MKATIDSKSIELVNDYMWEKDFSRKAEKECKKQRTFDLVADGIDAEIAKLMVDFDLDTFCN